MNSTILDLLAENGISTVQSAEAFFRSKLIDLQKDGSLDLGEDKDLSGLSLELRVKNIFSSVGIGIDQGRPGQEDFVIANTGENRDSIVIEVKSSKGATPKLDDLRQLDDWVFDLSGEEQARKSGLVGGIDPRAMATDGLMSSPKRHPTPHKGILVFNGPVGMPFERRGDQMVHENHIEFIKKRNFCIIGIHDLITLSQKGREEVLKSLSATVGLYRGT